MIELWDDRCIQVIPNTGRTIADEIEVRANGSLRQIGFTITSLRSPQDRATRAFLDVV